MANIGICPDCLQQTSAPGRRCLSCRSRKVWQDGRPIKLHQVRRGRDLTEIEAAWLGAMVEGEGSVIWRKSATCRRRSQAVLQVCNSDVEVIATCLRLAGTGCVYLRTMTKQPPHWKPVWFWLVSAQRDIVYLLSRIHPYLTSKQERARDIVSVWETTWRGEQTSTVRQ